MVIEFSPKLAAGSIKLQTGLFGTALEKSTMTPDEYMKAVLEAKEHILAGDIFQIVLSQRFERRTFADPFEVYRALRIVNPSPYMTYLQVCFIFHLFSWWRVYLCVRMTSYLFISCYQARGCILVASSPEILTRVKKVNYYDEARVSHVLDAFLLLLILIAAITSKDTISRNCSYNPLVFLSCNMIVNFFIFLFKFSYSLELTVKVWSPRILLFTEHYY